MADPLVDRAKAAAGIKLSPFCQVFFEEAGDNLENLEQRLLRIDLAAVDDEELHAIFRCAHSVKGGAAAFGFSDVAELTHQMETLLDKLRRHELAPQAAMVDLLLQAGDALRSLLARHQGKDTTSVDTRELRARIRALTAAAGTAPSALRDLELTLGPLDRADIADIANAIVDLFREIQGLGTIEPLDGGRMEDGMRRFRIGTASSDDELLDLMGFHVARDQARLAPFGPGHGFHAGSPGAPAQPDAPVVDSACGFFDPAPGTPASAAVAAAMIEGPATAAGPDSSTLRVSVEKVDQLINLVGELVITQAMLARNSQGPDAALDPQLAAGLADLKRHTSDLQDAVMSIRMIPMALVFNRFPRMLRDLAAKLDKKVELLQVGATTELDKGLVEKITDPLTHLVRNSCDHGIERPAERLAQGKPECGTITLMARHQGGSIVIEVRDDGKGLNRQKLLAKARERGIDAPDTMADADVWALIFAPGFSTAEVVTDVSGRGVGMDVVKKTVDALGGTIEIDSAEGCGMSVKVRLPLTLAILDGISVGVGPECYILPLGSVVESFQAGPDTIRTIGGCGRVVQVRDAFVPLVELEEVFRVPRADGGPGKPIMVIVEAEGARAALRVDELLGQHQVVVKNLEANYRKVDDISGATIMSDGRVALILDVASLVRRSRH